MSAKLIGQNIMTNKNWKKNDALMKAALRKMGLTFSRDTMTWEVYITASLGSKRHQAICCYDADDNLVDEGPNTPESLGEIKYFYITFNYDIDNIFFGVKNYEELKIKLDLMASDDYDRLN